MSQLAGILVYLTTSDAESWAGTDDHIYVGIVGTDGGREFALDTTDYNDFEIGTTGYRIGDAIVFWDGEPDGTEKTNFSAHSGYDLNDWPIELDAVTHVYLRKAGTSKGDADDAYILGGIRIALYGTQPQKMVFQSRHTVTLANRDGLQVWIPRRE